MAIPAASRIIATATTVPTTRCPRRKQLLADEGRICEQQVPPWQTSGKGHRILCHIPIETLKQIDPVVHNGVGA